MRSRPMDDRDQRRFKLAMSNARRARKVPPSLVGTSPDLHADAWRRRKRMGFFVREDGVVCVRLTPKRHHKKPRATSRRSDVQRTRR